MFMISEDNFEKLFRKLRNSDDVWGDAAEIAKRKDQFTEEHIQKIIAGLSDEDSKVRYVCALILMHTGRKEAVEPLIECVDDPEASVRMVAVASLGGLKYPRAEKKLIEALEDPNENVRASAAVALGNLGSTDKIEPLMKALGDPALDVGNSAATALGESKEFITDEQFQQIVDWLWSGGKNRRICSAIALGNIGKKEAEEPLLKALRDPDVFVCREAVRALGKLRNNAVLYAVALITGSGYRHSIEDIEVMIKELKDNRIANEVVGAVIQIGDTRSLECLEEALENEIEVVRVAAVASLSELKGPEVVELLLRASSDESSVVFEIAAKAVGILREYVTEEQFQDILSGLWSRDSNERYRCATLLGELGKKEATGPLLTVLENHEIFRVLHAMESIIDSQYYQNDLDYIQEIINERLEKSQIRDTLVKLLGRILERKNYLLSYEAKNLELPKIRKRRKRRPRMWRAGCKRLTT